MSYINQITLQGNLGKDAETKHTPDGTPVTTFSMATGGAPGKGPLANCPVAVCFADLAEEAAWLAKGKNARAKATVPTGPTQRAVATTRVGEFDHAPYAAM